jgi:hypothetical protein
MGKRTAPRAKRLGMPGRRSRPHPGPRRHAPGLAALGGRLLAAFLAGAPVAGLAAWHWAYTSGQRAQRAEQAAVRQVLAVVLPAAPGHGEAAAGTGSWPADFEALFVRVRWTAPGGTPCTGEIPVRSGISAGRTVTVWTSASGQLADPPLTSGQVTAYAVLAALAAVALLALTLTGAGRLTRHLAARGHSGEGTRQAQPAMPSGPPRMPGAAAQPSRPAAAAVIPPPEPRAGPGAAARQPVPASYAALWRASLRSADRAGCCPARPSVIAVMPPAGDRPHPTELLLCRHHYRVHRAALMAAGAAIYESDAVTPVSDAAGPASAAWSRTSSPA